MVEALRKSAMLLKAIVGVFGLWGGGLLGADAKSFASIMSYESSVEVESTFTDGLVRDMMAAHNGVSEETPAILHEFDCD